MARKSLNIVPRVYCDYEYNNPNIGKFINMIMKDGKKHKAYLIVYNSLKKASEVLKQDPISLFDKVLENISSEFVMIVRKVGNTNIQIPVNVDKHKQTSRALIRLKNIIRDKRTKGLDSTECLSEELINAYNSKGSAVKKKEEIEQLSIKHKVFAHYSWMKQKIEKPTIQSKKER